MTTRAGSENRIPVTVHRRGQSWTGFYVIEPDGRLVVASAYGSKTEPLGRKKADKLAEKLLGEIVETWGR